MNGVWEQLELGGKPADVYQPPGPGRPRGGVLFLHAYDNRSLRGQDAFTRRFDELGLACVCPMAPGTWWTDRRSPAFDPQLAEEFWRAFVTSAAITLHIRLRAGKNTHHILEAIFKASARAFRMAWELDPRCSGVPSTKGVL